MEVTPQKTKQHWDPVYGNISHEDILEEKHAIQQESPFVSINLLAVANICKFVFRYVIGVMCIKWLNNTFFYLDLRLHFILLDCLVTVYILQKNINILSVPIFKNMAKANQYTYEVTGSKARVSRLTNMFPDAFKGHKHTIKNQIWGNAKDRSSIVPFWTCGFHSVQPGGSLGTHKLGSLFSICTPKKISNPFVLVQKKPDQFFKEVILETESMKFNEKFAVHNKLESEANTEEIIKILSPAMIEALLLIEEEMECDSIVFNENSVTFILKDVLWKLSFWDFCIGQIFGKVGINALSSVQKDRIHIFTKIYRYMD